MKLMFGNKTPSKAMIYNWIIVFSRGHKNLSDDVQMNHPRSAVTSKPINAVRKLTTSDWHVTHDETEISLNISRICIHSILHNHLKEKKVCSHLIPNNLSQVKKGT